MRSVAWFGPKTGPPTDRSIAEPATCFKAVPKEFKDQESP